MEIENFINLNIKENYDKKTLFSKLSQLFCERVEILAYDNDNYTDYTNFYCLNLKQDVPNPAPFEMACHGLIFNMQNKLVCWNLPNLYQIDNKITGEIDTKITDNITKWKELYDGAVMRMFYDETNKKWILTTTRQIDANVAKWNNTTNFADLFKKYLYGSKNLTSEQKYINFCKSLNTDYNYIFVLHIKETCKYLKSKIKPKIIHVETYNIKKHEIVPFLKSDIESANENTGEMVIKKEGIYEFVEPTKFYNFEKKENIKNKYNSDDVYGLIGLLSLNNVICGYKLINDKVWKKIEYMSNNPNVSYNIVNNICRGKKEEFMTLYPELKNDIIDLDLKISKSAKKIYEIYMKCFVSGRNNPSYKKEIGQWCKPVIFFMHDYYCGGNGKITYEVTKHLMMSLGAPVVASIIGINI